MSQGWTELEPGQAETGPDWNRAKLELGLTGTGPSWNWAGLELAKLELDKCSVAWWTWSDRALMT